MCQVGHNLYNLYAKSTTLNLLMVKKIVDQGFRSHNLEYFRNFSAIQEQYRQAKLDDYTGCRRRLFERQRRRPGQPIQMVKIVAAFVMLLAGLLLGGAVCAAETLMKPSSAKSNNEVDGDTCMEGTDATFEC